MSGCALEALPATGRSARIALAACLAASLVLSTLAVGPVQAQQPAFADVPDDSYYTAAVLALAENGVFVGTECGDGLFCPDMPIPRWQMAVWTVRALNGEDPPTVDEYRFGDVDEGDWYAAHVDQMFRLGVTGGCGDGTNFCPDRSVSRAEMAVFLTRAYDLPPGPDPGFGDVPTDAWYADQVAALARSGITSGCGDGTNFCPDRVTTRAQMATFLARALGLVEVPEPATEADGTEDGTDAADPYAITDVITGYRNACALPADWLVICWGSPNTGPVPTGTFTAVSAGSLHSCGIRTDSTVECWGDYYQFGRVNVPDGTFTAVSAGWQHSCGIRTDSTVECWSEYQFGAVNAPDGTFTAVSPGWRHTCGIRTDSTVECWGSNSDPFGGNFTGQANAPRGTFTAVSAGHSHTCGIRADSAVECWGSNSDLSGNFTGQANAPRGTFTAVSAGDFHTCGIRTDGAVECWGSNSDPFGGNFTGQANAPDGTFTAVSAGSSHTCGIRIDGVIECWGNNDHGQTDGFDRQPQLQPFRHRSAPRDNARGQTDGLDREVIPSVCRPRGRPRGTTAGFPLPGWAAPSTGTVRLAVLFMDFPNAQAAHATQLEVADSLPAMERFFKITSNSKLDVEFETLHRWLRAENDYQHYLEDRGGSDPRLEGGTLSLEATKHAVALADREIDFSRTDGVMLVFPSDQFSLADATGNVTVDNTLLPTFRMNIRPRTNRRAITSNGTAVAHEFLHILGLPDLYPIPRLNIVPPEQGQSSGIVEFGMMGLHALFHIADTDPRLSRARRLSDEHRVDYSPIHYEMLGWGRWQLGWLDADQVACVEQGTATVSLRPMGDLSGGVLLAIIPVTSTKAIVVENRRPVGFDYASTFLNEGVLVYTVDASLDQLPLKLAGDNGNGFIGDYPLLRAGESTSVWGHKIEVLPGDGTGFSIERTWFSRVRISRLS